MLDCPLTSNTNEDGVICFINDMDNDIVYIDTVSFEGLITFHDAQFGISDVYFIDEGRNNTNNNVFKELHDERVVLKKDENPADN